MFWSFRKSKRVGKHGRVTLSKSGVSASYGGKRGRVTVSRRRGLRASFNLLGFRITKKLF